MFPDTAAATSIGNFFIITIGRDDDDYDHDHDNDNDHGARSRPTTTATTTTPGARGFCRLQSNITRRGPAPSRYRIPQRRCSLEIVQRPMSESLAGRRGLVVVVRRSFGFGFSFLVGGSEPANYQFGYVLSSRISIFGVVALRWRRERHFRHSKFGERCRHKGTDRFERHESPPGED